MGKAKQRRRARLVRELNVAGTHYPGSASGIFASGIPGYTLTVELPPDATLQDVSAAVIEIERIARLTETLAPCCGVPTGTVHHLECPEAPRDLLARVRAEYLELSAAAAYEEERLSRQRDLPEGATE